MLTIDEYAIKLVTDGAESCVEDDLNEDGEVADEDHDAAVARAYAIIRAIRAYPASILSLADAMTAPGSEDGDPSMTITVTLSGGSDDRIELGGGIYEEFGYQDDPAGNLVAFSDGTVLRIKFGEDVAWRITPVARGTAELSMEQAIEEDDADVATLTGDIRWAVHGLTIAKAKV